MWPIIAGAALAGGLLNSLSASSQRNEMNARIQSLIDEYKKQTLDAGKIEGQVERTSGIFNQSLNNLMTSTAFSSRGAINSGVAKAAAAGPVIAQKSQAIEGVYENADKWNMAIQDKITQLKAGQPVGDTIGDFMGGAVQGGIAGAQISNLAEMTPTDKISSDNTAGIMHNSPFNNFPSAENLPPINKLSNMASNITPTNSGYYGSINQNFNSLFHDYNAPSLFNMTSPLSYNKSGIARTRNNWNF